MSQYKLSYFDTAGPTEVIRFILSYGGQDYEDVRIKLADWGAVKPTTPYGQVPVLDIDGKRYHQSLAIARYLAKQFKLTGSNDLEDLEIDGIVETLHDFRLLFSAYFWDPNPEEKAKKKEALINEKIPFYLDRFETQIKENGGYFVGGKVTWADLMFAALQNYQNVIIGFDVIKDHPALKAFEEKILAIPSIKAWVDKRPTSCIMREVMARK